MVSPMSIVIWSKWKMYVSNKNDGLTDKNGNLTKHNQTTLGIPLFAFSRNCGLPRCHQNSGGRFCMGDLVGKYVLTKWE